MDIRDQVSLMFDSSVCVTLISEMKLSRDMHCKPQMHVLMSNYLMNHLQYIYIFIYQHKTNYSFRGRITKFLVIFIFIDMEFIQV